MSVSKFGSMTGRALVIVVLGLGFAATGRPSQSAPADCIFRDVVRNPNGGPAVLKTWPHPNLSELLLPPGALDVKAWVRVATDGSVSDVCVPDTPEGFREPIVEAVRRLRYVPARHDGRTVPTVNAVNYQIEARLHGRGIQEPISTSADVSWLERIAASDEAAFALWSSQRQRIGQPKDLRVAAYARLGQIGTADSVRAQKTVASAFRETSLVERGAMP